MQRVAFELIESLSNERNKHLLIYDDTSEKVKILNIL